ncbi:MAG: proline--tRNA ligase [Candidatus Hydrogenedentota bacterium]
MTKGITKRSEDYSQWYIDVVLKADMADYAPVDGCMVIKPNGYGVWEKMQQALDVRFKETGHVNAYFPMLIPERIHEQEAGHAAGLTAECAVVTQGGGKTLDEPLVIRPSSEAIIWSCYKNWINTHHDLPVLINQWANMCRWEMRTRLFLRTTEFLWQEGHTAHATYEDAEAETLRMVHVYQQFAEEFMAMPVITGRKTDREKSAGALHSYCVEGLMQDGKVLQAGAAHNLGQNIAKAFDVTFQDDDKQVKHVYGARWAVSTRLICAMVMTHSDDNGLVLPPRLAPRPVAIVPSYNNGEERAKVLAKAREITRSWAPAFFCIDDREQHDSAFKSREWEMKGVPVRIEIGPGDADNNSVVAVRRDTGDRTTLFNQGLRERLRAMLEDIQQNLYNAARRRLEVHTHTIDDFGDYKGRVGKGGLFRVFLDHENPEVEERLWADTKSRVCCIPFDAPDETGFCMITGKRCKGRVIAARAY